MYDLGPRLRTVLIALFLIVLSLAMVQGTRAAPWWQSSVNVESKIGTDRSIQSLDVMYPLSHTEDSLTFTDLRGRVDDESSVELNLGLAHRSVMEDPLGLTDEAVVGYYGFFDRLESQFDNTFYQATAGAEYFTKDYSLRFNGYLPEDETADAGSLPLTLVQTGTQIYFQSRTSKEKPLPGFDLEAGRTFRYDWGQLYGRASYFHFDDSDAQEIAGSRLRAGVQVPGERLHESLPDGSQFTLGAEWQRDDVRDEQSFGVFRVRVPFGSSVGGRGSGVESQNGNEDRKSKIEKDVNGERSTVNGSTTSKASKSSPSMGEDIDGGDDSRLETQGSGLKSWQKDRLTERIERDVDIVTGRTSGSGAGTDTEPAVNVANGRSLNKVAFARADASGTGVASNPASLPDALSRAGENGLIVALPGGDTFTTDGLTLAEGQYLTGGKTTLALRPQGGETVHSLTIGSGGKAVLEEETDASTLLRIDTGTAGQTVHNFELTGGTTAIRGRNVADVTVDNVDVRNTDGNALQFNEAPDLKLTNVGVTDAGKHGVFLNRGEELTLRDLTVETAGRTGVKVQNFEGITANNIDVKNTSHDGITFHTIGDTPNVYGNLTSDSAGNTGILLDGQNATVSGLTSRVSENGINIELSNSVVKDVTVDTVTLHEGVYVPFVDSLVLENINVHNPETYGLRLYETSDVMVRDLSVDSAPEDGFFDNQSSNLSLENVDIGNTADHGMTFFKTQNLSLGNVSVEDVDRDGIFLDRTDGATATGLTINDAGHDGIAINANDVGLSDVNVETVDGRGVYVDGPKNLTLEDVSVKHAGTTGFAIDADTVTGQNLSVTDAGYGSGIPFGGFSLNGSNHTFTDISADSVSGDGVHLNAGESSLNGVSVTDAANDGVEVDADDVTLADVTVNTAGERGVNVDVQKNITLDGVSTSQTREQGIYVDADTVSGQNLSVHDVANQEGMSFQGSNHTVSDVSVDSAAQAGIWFEAHNTSADSVTVSNADAAGIQVRGDTTELTEVDVSMVEDYGINARDADSVTISAADVREVTDGGVGIRGSNLTDLTVRDASVRNVTDQGFVVNDADTVLVDGVNSRHTTAAGLSVLGSDTVTVTDASVFDAGGDGMVLFQGTNHTYSNLAADSVAEHGIEFRSPGAVADSVTVKNVGQNGIDVGADDVTVTDLTVNTAGNYGVNVDNQDTFTLDGAEISTTDENGVNVEDASNVTIRDLGAGYVNRGLYLDNTTDVDIDTMTLNGSDVEGIYAYYSDSIDITGYTSVNSDEGLDLYNADTVTATNLTVKSSTGNAINVFNGSDTVTLANVTVTNPEDRGISVDDSANVEITDATVTGAGSDGILADFGSSDVTVDSAAIADADGYGLRVAPVGKAVSDVDVSDVTVTNSSRGIELDASNVTADDLSVSTINDTGMIFAGSDHTLSDLAADSVDSDAIHFRATNATADSISVTDGGKDGVVVDTDDVSLSDVIVRNVDDRGIALTDADSVGLTGVEVTEPGGNGIYLEDSSKVTMSDVTVDTSGSHAVRLTGASDTVSMDSVAITRTLSGGGVQIDGPSTNFTLTDATIRKTSNLGISSTNAVDSGFTLRNVTVEQTGNGGISLGGAHDVSLTDLTLREMDNNALTLFNSDSVALDTVNVHDVSGGKAISIERSNNVDVSGLTVTNVNDDDSFLAAVSFGGSNMSLSDVTVDTASVHGVQLGAAPAPAPPGHKEFDVSNMDISNVDGAGLIVSKSADTVTMTNTTITNADTGVRAKLLANFGDDDGLRNINFGPNFEVKGPVDTIFDSINSNEDLVDPSGTILTPSGNLSCSIEGTVTGSMLTLDDGTTTKTVNNGNCP